MATIYNIICPKCGKQYQAMKGILMSECNLDPIPEERDEENPVMCPHCGEKLSLQDEGSRKNIQSVMMAD